MTESLELCLIFHKFIVLVSTDLGRLTFTLMRQSTIGRLSTDC